MKELFGITNCYQDNNYYYFFRALNRRDMIGIRNKSILDDDGHISKIITDSTFYNRKDRYNEESSLTLEEMINHVKTRYDRDTNCISLSSDANVCLTYGRKDYEDKYVIIKVPKDELGKTTFIAGKYIYEEMLKRVNDYLNKHQNDLTDLQKYYISALSNITTRKQLDNLKKTLPKEYVDVTHDKFKNGLNLINSKPYEGYSDEENLSKDKLIMLLDVLNFEAARGKTNILLVQTMGSAFSARELEYYKEVPKEKIVEMPTSLIEIMAILQQVPETKEIKEIKNYLITHLDEIRLSTKEINYNNFCPEDLDFSFDNLYSLTEGKISHKDAKELYLNSMYLAKAKLRAYASIRLLDDILGNNPKYQNTLQSILDSTLGIEPAIMSRDNINRTKVSDTVILNLSEKYQDVYNYINSLQVNDMCNLFKDPTSTFNTLFSKYISGISTVKQDKEEWYANALIDSANLKALNVLIDFSTAQRQIIIDSLKDNNFLDYYDSVKTLSSDSNIATSMLASLVANRKEFTDNPDMSLEQLKTYIGYNTLKEYELPLRNIQRIGYEELAKSYFYKNFATAVMPTGSGKSFLALAEMLNHKLNKMLYLAPNDIIIKQIEDYIFEFLGCKDYHALFPNLTITTYQDLRDYKINTLKEKYNIEYDFIILDELHRSGAPDWSKYVLQLMDRQDKKKVKVLGLTATPERDRDDWDMSAYWARYFGYTDEEIELNDHLAVNETLEGAITKGLLANPKFINCLYIYKSDGSLDAMREKIAMISDADKKARAYAKYEQCCRMVEQSSGIEKILGDYLKPGVKYPVFLPVSRNKDGFYETEDGTKVSKVQAVEIVEDYSILIRQYLYSNEYMKIHGKQLLSIYNKITERIELSSEDMDFLGKEQDDIMLLDMIKIKHKPAALNTFNSIVVSTIARHLGWKKLDKETLKTRIEAKTCDMVEINSLLSYYSDSKNKKELESFNEEADDKPKLLLVMDKLNEGAHLKGVNGIVWLRPLGVKSRILFYQQMGRGIHSYGDDHVFTEEERPIILDLVNNINTVNLKRDQSPVNDLEDLRKIITWINENGGKFPNKASGILEEKNHGLKLNTILYRYIKYFNNPEELDNIKDKIVIEKILRLGSEIDLWDIKINEPTRKRKEKESEEEEEKFLKGFLQVESLVSDFVNLKKGVDDLLSSEAVFDKIFSYLETLKNQGVDINSIAYNDKLKIIKNGDDYSLQIIKIKTKYENGLGTTVINKDEYKESGLIRIGSYVNAFRQGKAYRDNIDSNSPDLTDDQISKLRTLDFIFNWEVNPVIEPKNFDDYLLILDKMQKAKDKTGYDINNIKAYFAMTITKTNDDYGFEIFEDRDEARKKYGNSKRSLDKSKVINIGNIINYFKRGKNFVDASDLKPNQIENLRKIGLEVVPEKERDPIMEPKCFDDYLLILDKMQKAKDKTGYDINDIKMDFVVRITKTSDDYNFEVFTTREKAIEIYGKTVKTIGIGRAVYWFKRGKNSNVKDDLNEIQISKLKSLNFMFNWEVDRIMEPKSFDDYLIILDKMQKAKEKTGYDINDIKYGLVVRITKINNNYEFEFFENREEAIKKYGKTVKTVGIGSVIGHFKRGKSCFGTDDLKTDQIEGLRKIGLKVKLEKERDPIIEPKSFDDYLLLLQALQNAKLKTGYDINDITQKIVIRITKINDEYKFEYFANAEAAKKIYGDAVEIIRIGSVIGYFKRGKNSAGISNLQPSQIEDLRKIGLEVKLEKDRDPIMEPKSFDDYLLILDKMQKAKDKTGYDINDIKSEFVIRITKVNDEYNFEVFATKEKAESQYGDAVEIIRIGRVINNFKKGKNSGDTFYLELSQIKKLRKIGLKVIPATPEEKKDPILNPKSFEDYVLLLRKLQEKYDIDTIIETDKMRITKNGGGYDFQIIHKEMKRINGKRVTVNSDEYNQKDLMGIGTKIYLFKSGKYSNKTYLTVEQMKILLSIDFKFNKGIEDKIYKQEICKNLNINLEINDKIIERISKIELVSKIKYLNDKGFAIVDASGQLIDIFSMSSADIENDQRYGVSLENIINIYGKGMERK